MHAADTVPQAQASNVNRCRTISRSETAKCIAGLHRRPTHKHNRRDGGAELNYADLSSFQKRRTNSPRESSEIEITQVDHAPRCAVRQLREPIIDDFTI